MKNGIAFICVCARRYDIIPFITLFIIATIVLYNHFVRPPYVPHVGRQQCAWSKTKTKVSLSSETPPWLLQFSNYNNATVSRRNLYVWPFWPVVPYRLGNSLFVYATTFGIAWRNRRIPIWPKGKSNNRFDITKFFNLRIPVDRSNAIIHVSLRSSSTLVLSKPA